MATGSTTAPGESRRTTNRWIVGARLRTLPASVVPVLVGTACAFGGGAISVARFVLAALVALALQVAVNYANDYSDGVRGTDAERVGPARLVASGLASPAAVQRAAMVAFAVAAGAGAALAVLTTPWLFVVGLAAMAAAWLYTGGPKPYGYLGLGELFVFVFFGLVATVGSTYVQHRRLTALAFLAGVAMGSLSCALLVVNNLRDIPTDAAAGKRTLAVRLGAARTRWLYLCLIDAAFVCVVLAAIARPWSLIALGALPLAAMVMHRVRCGATGTRLVVVLGETARLQLVLGGLLAIGLIIGRH